MVRRTFPYDSDGVPSLDVRIQVQGRSSADLSGTVDSGASKTVLSMADAEELGLTSADLHDAGTAIVADGSKVGYLTTDMPIRAQVLRPSPTGELHPWGPVFAINPVFVEGASPLWGQADFFASFGVMFWRNSNPAAFELGF